MGKLLLIDFAPIRDRAEREAYEDRRDALRERPCQENPLAGAEWPQSEPHFGSALLVSAIGFVASAVLLWRF